MSAKKSPAKKPAAKKKATARKKATAGKPAKTGQKPAAAPKPNEMEPDVLEFIQAIDDYKRQAARPFPSWSEILEIVKRLGYERGE